MTTKNGIFFPDHIMTIAEFLAKMYNPENALGGVYPSPWQFWNVCEGCEKRPGSMYYWMTKNDEGYWFYESAILEAS